MNEFGGFELWTLNPDETDTLLGYSSFFYNKYVL
jgi:hypothetical protein